MTETLPTLGKYHLLRKVGVGGMAEVFLARVEGPGGFEKLVVVKRILPHLSEDPSFVSMFLAEARLAARLDHPNVVQVFDFGEVDGAFFLVMEFVDGPNLRSLMRRAVDTGEAVPVGVAGRLVSAACEGLAHAHELVDPGTGEPLKIVHRDVSPDNILVSRSGAVKVVDFGIAKAADRLNLTKTGAVKGKLAYMAPEQLRGEPLDRRTDVFALGMVFNELLLGHKPFDVGNEAAVIRGLLYERIPLASDSRSDVRAGLAEILERALAKEPSARYPDCRAFQAELDGYLSHEEPYPSNALVAAFVQRFAVSQVPPSRPSAPLPQLGSVGGAAPKPQAPPVASRDSGLATAPRVPETHEGRQLPVEVDLSLSGFSVAGATVPGRLAADTTAPLMPNVADGGVQARDERARLAPGLAGGSAAAPGVAVRPVESRGPQTAASVGQIPAAPEAPVMRAESLATSLAESRAAQTVASVGAAAATQASSQRPAMARHAVIALGIALLLGGLVLLGSWLRGTDGPGTSAVAPSPAGAGDQQASPALDAAVRVAELVPGRAGDAAAAALGGGERPMPPAPAEAPGVDGGGSRVVPDAGARALITPLAVGAAPLQPGERRPLKAPGQRGASAAGSVPSPASAAGVEVRTGSAGPADASAPAESGVVDFRVRPFGVVWLDGRLLGETPFAPVRLRVGVHSVKVVNRELGKEVQSTLEVHPGQNTFKLNLEAAPSGQP